MSKKFFYNLLLILFLAAAAVFWLLSVVLPESIFAGFTLAWAVVLLSGGWGVTFILQGLFYKNAVPLKKLTVYLGCGMLVVTVFALVSAIALPENYVLPIIAVLLVAALLLGMLAVGGKKWDQGDNKKVGYKNYYQRKAEEEKQRAKEEKDQND